MPPPHYPYYPTTPSTRNTPTTPATPTTLPPPYARVTVQVVQASLAKLISLV